MTRTHRAGWLVVAGLVAVVVVPAALLARTGDDPLIDGDDRYFDNAASPNSLDFPCFEDPDIPCFTDIDSEVDLVPGLRPPCWFYTVVCNFGPAPVPGPCTSCPTFWVPGSHFSRPAKIDPVEACP